MAANNGKICFHSQQVHKLNTPLLNLNLSFVRTPIPHNVCPLQEQLRCSKSLTTSEQREDFFLSQQVHSRLQ
jgi:hypothetical protein